MTKKQYMQYGSIAVIALVCFWGGMKYGESKTVKSAIPNGQLGFQGADRPMSAGSRRGFQAGGGFTGGEILTKDASGITIKLRDGSAKIILVPGSASVLKATTGSPDDLAAGEQVTITGTQNTDGSITAQTIQIRPAGMSGQPTAPVAR